MAGSRTKSSNAPRVRKRVEVEDSSPSALKRARDGSAFAKCEGCNKDVPVALISFHNCTLDAKIKMNLEAQVVETPNEVKKKPVEKKKSISTEPKTKKEKKAKNPNARKRPPTAFFLFMEDFRKSFKEANPDCKSVATVAKEGGEKWKSMSDEEKKTYTDRAAELKAEYAKASESDANDEGEAESASEEAKDETEVDEAKDEAEADEAKDEGEADEAKDEGQVDEAKNELEDDDV